MYEETAIRAARRPRRRKRRGGFFILVLLALCAAGFFLLQERGEERRLEEDEIPPQLLALYERNPDAYEYVRAFPEESGMEHEIELTKESGGGEVPLLMQWDKRWGYAQYAGDYFGLTGCGPTCLSMVALYLTGDASMNPQWMGEYATQNGYAAWNNGTQWALFSEGCDALGLKSSELPLSESDIARELESGNPIVCIMGPGDFTTTGHFIVLTGLEDGEYCVNDPNSYQNSKKTWTYDELEGQIRNLWAFEVR